MHNKKIILKNIILLGPQGSGKSTQGHIISEHLGVPVLSAGNVLRKLISSDDPKAQKVAAVVNKGAMVSDDYMIELLENILVHPEYQDGVILDGFPRTIYQAGKLDKYHHIDKVFNIEISDQEAITRISGRLICDEGHVFHIKHHQPKTKNICDVCGHPLQRRADDDPETVAKRLKLYREETSKLLGYYQDQGKLVIFNGEQTIEAVSSEIINYIESHV